MKAQATADIEAPEPPAPGAVIIEGQGEVYEPVHLGSGQRGRELRAERGTVHRFEGHRRPPPGGADKCRDFHWGRELAQQAVDT